MIHEVLVLPFLVCSSLHSYNSWDILSAQNFNFQLINLTSESHFNFLSHFWRKNFGVFCSLEYLIKYHFLETGRERERKKAMFCVAVPPAQIDDTLFSSIVILYSIFEIIVFIYFTPQTPIINHKQSFIINNNNNILISNSTISYSPYIFFFF